MITLKSFLGYNLSYKIARLRNFIKYNAEAKRLISRLEEHFSQSVLNRIAHLTNEFHDCNNLYVYWHQGWAKAPTPISRIADFNSNALENKEKIVRLDFESVSKLIPPSQEFSGVRRLWEEGNLTLASFSDYLRLSLISRHGGTWLDSTVLINPYFFEEDFNSQKDSIIALAPQKKSFATIQTWAFKSNQSSEFLAIWAKCLSEIWLENGGNYSYFDSFIVASHLLRQGIKLQNNLEENSQRRILNYRDSLLRSILNEERTNIIYEAFRSSSVHKLSHKVSFSEAKRMVRAIDFLEKKL